jgi:hypothetical protein
VLLLKDLGVDIIPENALQVGARVEALTVYGIAGAENEKAAEGLPHSKVLPE